MGRSIEIEDHVGKLLDDRSAGILGNDLKCFGTASNGLQALLHSLKKYFTQAGFLLVVPLVRLLDITFRRG